MKTSKVLDIKVDISIGDLSNAYTIHTKLQDKFRILINNVPL